jgi:hypothetical protein
MPIGPTSRPGDLICLLFSRPNCDAASNFAQAYSSMLGDKKPPFSAIMLSFQFNPSKGNALGEDW